MEVRIDANVMWMKGLTVSNHLATRMKIRVFRGMLEGISHSYKKTIVLRDISVNGKLNRELDTQLMCYTF